MTFKHRRCPILTENMINTVRVVDIKEECPGVKTIHFKIKLKSPKPGQFLMIWMPGIDEIPMSVSGWDNLDNWSFTVKEVGECTKFLSGLKKGDYIGVRGPLGNHFKIPNDSSIRIILIGGGTGIAPLKFLSDELLNQRRTFTFIEGAKSENQLIFKDLLKKNKKVIDELIFCTDDGSFGPKAFASEALENYITKLSKEHHEKIMIYACGPELMMYEVFKICMKFNLKMQASLERVMRCGCGICGLCALDPLGLLVCRDGPVFNFEQLKQIEDFGNYKRDFSGKKIKLN